MSNGEIVTRGGVGTGLSLAAALFSPELENGLRGISLIVGIVAGLVTIWTLLRKAKTNEKN